MVAPEFPPFCGGIGWYVYYLSREMASRGNIISVLIRSVGSVKPFGPFKITGANAGVVPPINSFRMINKIRACLRSDPHDVAIVHSTTIGAWLRDIPTILVSHWCIAEGQKTFYRGAYDVKSLLHVIFRMLYTYVEKKSIRGANAVAVVSNAMKNEIHTHYGKSAVYIGNAVDKELFSPSEDTGNRGVTLPSMLRSGKGVRQAVQVIQRLRGMNCNIPFRFIGTGPMKSWLLKKLERIPLTDVQLLEPVEHSRLKELYRDNSIVFLPSHYEGLPNVALEAMASGLPVVATNVGGTAEAVIHGQTGFVHSIHDVDGMAESILKLDQDSGLRRRYGMNGRKRVCKEFNWQVVGDRVESLIKQIA